MKIQLEKLILKEPLTKNQQFFYKSEVVFWLFIFLEHPDEKTTYFPSRKKVLNGIIHIASNDQRALVDKFILEIKDSFLSDLKAFFHVFSGEKKYTDLLLLHESLIKNNDKTIKEKANEIGFKLEQKIVLPFNNFKINNGLEYKKGVVEIIIKPQNEKLNT